MLRIQINAMRYSTHNKIPFILYTKIIELKRTYNVNQINLNTLQNSILILLY